LHEDVGKVEWPPTIETQGWRVLLSASSTLYGCHHSGLYRASPVFPATSGFRKPDLRRGVYYLCFFCFDPAFPVLGRLLLKAPQAIKSGLLYTTGLASILLVTKHRSLADTVENIAGVRVTAKEIWHVDRCRIKSVSCECSTPDALSREAPRLLPHNSLPLVARTTVDEFVANMAILLPKVEVHIPSEMCTYAHLTGQVNELISEMVYATSPNGAPPDTLSEYTEEQFSTDALLRNSILDQNIDRLVQINSALSYVSTQALTGAVPILDRRSLIRRYSLLGVGTAVLALTRIAHSIESAFAQGAVEHILTAWGPDLPPLPGLDSLPGYEPRQWNDFSIDALKASVEPQRPNPKLPYFSGRLGFRETEYTISAALQALAAGACAEWSILTVTHEMVHGHVRKLLSAVFQGDPSRTPDKKWREFYDRFKARCERNPPRKESLLDSLRAIIFAYCCSAKKHGSLTWDTEHETRRRGNGEIRIPIELYTPSSLWAILQREYRNISEIIVHVLDLHYFYRSCISHYIHLIWSSWAKAPQVRGDLRQYLLRSLLVVAAKKQGTPHERFCLACTALADLLEPLRGPAGEHIPVIEEAVNLLKDDKYTGKSLFFPFYASLILADLAHHVLTSAKIRGAVNAGDPHLRPAIVASTNEEWLDYDMPDGFVDDVVKSPTAYIAHRLTQPTSLQNGRDIEAETATLFLACSSHPVDGGSHA